VIALRLATADDALALHGIMDPLVRETHVTFADAAPPVEELHARLARELGTYPWIVATDRGRILGYAMARPWSPAPGQRWSVETGIALGPDARGQGLGSRLYTNVLAVVAAQGYVNAFALVTRPNDASERLHARLGFRRYGVIEREGYKHGRWHDVSCWQKRLRDGDPGDVLAVAAAVARNPLR